MAHPGPPPVGRPQPSQAAGRPPGGVPGRALETVGQEEADRPGPERDPAMTNPSGLSAANPWHETECRHGRSKPMSEDRQAAHGHQESPPMQAQDPTSSRRRAGARSPDRRRFLLGAGGLTAATLIGAAGGWSPPAQAALPAPARSSSSTQANGSSSWLATRRARALKLRIDTARRQLAGTFPRRQTNGDEDAYPAGLASFHQDASSQPPRRGRPRRLPHPAPRAQQRQAGRLRQGVPGGRDETGQPAGRVRVRVGGRRSLGPGGRTATAACL